MPQIHILPAFDDNYIYIVRHMDRTLVVDPGDAAPVIQFLEEKDWALNLIFVTHHHHDHIGGVARLKARYDAPVIGPAKEMDKVTSIDRGVSAGDRVTLSSIEFDVLETPGHTLGHIAFHAPTVRLLFCGDTLFGMGCGRMFEGTPDQMWGSLQSLAALPDDTLVYCGHEYTVANGRFAAAVEPENLDILHRNGAAQALRERNLPTVPSTIAAEKKTNPFLHLRSAQEFAALRAHKDAFK